MPTPVIVKIDRLYKTFKGRDKAVIDNLSTEIYPGRITALAGPDGAGKSTLIRSIAGLIRYDKGTVSVASFDAQTQAKHIHEICSYMPQKFGLYEDLTVVENLELYASLRRVTGEEKKTKFKALLNFTGLKNFQKRLAGRLSGGMKQKLGLACALLGQPKLLLLDEPSVGVDPISRRELWQMVNELLSDELAVLWSTSYLDEAEKSHWTILLSEGKKIFDGRPCELLEKMKGRCWQIQGLEASERRCVLMDILKQPQVMDATIQGRHVRILLRNEQELPPLTNGSYKPAKASFEDAYIDILGGSPGGSSALACEIEKKDLNGEIVISANSLSKYFGDFQAVKNNNFQIKRGEIFGLLGPNGAGKSTTFKMMCGLLQPSSGRAAVMGLDLKTASSKARNRIGYMAQKFSLYDHLSVLQNLKFFSGIYGLRGKRQQQTVKLMMDIFDLAQFHKMNAGALPLGFKQRLALSCAVMHQPDVLFLDEPTSGVDPITRREFWLHINALVAKGVTVMITTHFMDEAEYCDRIALIYRGENIATGTPEHLKKLAKSEQMPEPSLEDAFIALVLKSEKNRDAEEVWQG